MDPVNNPNAGDGMSGQTNPGSNPESKSAANSDSGLFNLGQDLTPATPAASSTVAPAAAAESTSSVPTVTDDSAKSEVVKLDDQKPVEAVKLEDSKSIADTAKSSSAATDSKPAKAVEEVVANLGSTFTPTDLTLTELTSPPEAQPMSKLKIALIVAGVVLVIGGVAAAVLFRSSNKNLKGDLSEATRTGVVTSPASPVCGDGYYSVVNSNVTNGSLLGGNLSLVSLQNTRTNSSQAKAPDLATSNNIAKDNGLTVQSPANTNISNPDIKIVSGSPAAADTSDKSVSAGVIDTGAGLNSPNPSISNTELQVSPVKTITPNPSADSNACIPLPLNNCDSIKQLHDNLDNYKMNDVTKKQLNDKYAACFPAQMANINTPGLNIKPVCDVTTGSFEVQIKDVKMDASGSYPVIRTDCYNCDSLKIQITSLEAKANKTELEIKELASLKSTQLTNCPVVGDNLCKNYTQDVKTAYSAAKWVDYYKALIKLMDEPKCTNMDRCRLLRIEMATAKDILSKLETAKAPTTDINFMKNEITNITKKMIDAGCVKVEDTCNEIASSITKRTQTSALSDLRITSRIDSSILGGIINLGSIPEISDAQLFTDDSNFTVNFCPKPQEPKNPNTTTLEKPSFTIQQLNCTTILDKKAAGDALTTAESEFLIDNKCFRDQVVTDQGRVSRDSNTDTNTLTQETRDIMSCDSIQQKIDAGGPKAMTSAEKVYYDSLCAGDTPRVADAAREVTTFADAPTSAPVAPTEEDTDQGSTPRSAQTSAPVAPTGSQAANDGLGNGTEIVLTAGSTSIFESSAPAPAPTGVSVNYETVVTPDGKTTQRVLYGAADQPLPPTLTQTGTADYVYLLALLPLAALLRKKLAK